MDGGATIGNNSVVVVFSATSSMYLEPLIVGRFSVPSH